MDYSELVNRSNSALDKVMQIPDWQIRGDLITMYNVLLKLLGDLDKESVNCRRLKKITLIYTEREKKVLQQLENLEKNLTFASLL